MYPCPRRDSNPQFHQVQTQTFALDRSATKSNILEITSQKQWTGRKS